MNSALPIHSSLSFRSLILATALFCVPAARAQGAKPAPATGVKPMGIAGFAPTMNFNASVSSVIRLVMKGNVLSSVIGSGTNGQTLTLLLCQDGTGSRTINWPGNVRLAGSGITLTKAANKCDAVTMVFDGFNWYETSRAMNISQ
jgi:hypothetical protein